jgi:hypothetical protein
MMRTRCTRGKPTVDQQLDALTEAVEVLSAQLEAGSRPGALSSHQQGRRRHSPAYRRRQQALDPASLPHAPSPHAIRS